MWSTSPAGRAALAWLLTPLSIEEFQSQYYERAPMHVARDRAGYYQRVFDLLEVERILYASELHKADIRLVKDGVPVRPESYLVPKPVCKENELEPYTDRVDADRISALFASGCSIVMHDVRSLSAPAANFCRELEMLFHHRVSPNMYLTPPGNQGFDAHYDTHDTAIVQIEGTKHWRVYESAFPLPLDDQTFDKRLHTPGKVCIEADLRPGDFLYIPRGFLHEAKANEDLSLHLTLGLYPRRWIQVLKKALDDAGEAAENALLRETATAESVPALHALLQSILAHSALCAAEVAIENQFVRERRNGLDGQMNQISRLRELGEESLVALRPNVLYELTESEKTARLAFSGKNLVFGAGASGIIRELEGAASRAGRRSAQARSQSAGDPA